MKARHETCLKGCYEKEESLYLKYIVLMISNVYKTGIIWNIVLTLSFKTNVIDFIFSKNPDNSCK